MIKGIISVEKREYTTKEGYMSTISQYNTQKTRKDSSVPNSHTVRHLK